MGRVVIYNIFMSMALITTIDINMEADTLRSINDGVTGEVSSGGMPQFDQGLRFAGERSLENNGDFSLARRLLEQDLSGAGPVVASEIQQIGFLSSDKNTGRFEPEIRRIAFPGAQPWSADDQ